MSTRSHHHEVSEKALEARAAIQDAKEAIRDLEKLLEDGPLGDEDALNEIQARLQRGDLSEAVILIGRLHPALADLPHAFERRA